MSKKIDERLQKKIYNDQDVAVEDFKCKNCGGQTVYDPKTQKLKCRYCDSLFDLPKVQAEEQDIEKLLKQGKVWSEADVYQCQSCGAKEILQAGEISVLCPFCGTNSVVKVEELPGLKPDGVDTFKFDKKQAAIKAETWAKRKHFAPNAFKRSVKAEHIHGIYNPVFTFDAKTTSTYRGRLGKNYTRTIYHNGQSQVVTETKYFNIRGTNKLDFDDLLVQASSNIDESIINSLQPFRTRELPAYQEEYLRGFGASAYNKSGQQCIKECRELMRSKIERNILSQYDYDVKVNLKVQTTFSGQTFKYVLVPIYVGHYRYRKKLYNFYVNGDSGKVAGKTPVSVFKVGLVVLLVLAIVAGLVYLMVRG